MTTTTDDVLREVFLTGLKNAHAVEHQALALMDRQIDRAKNYPEVAVRLKSHRVETEEQIRRLEAILGGMGEDSSGLKDMALSLSGNLAALGHAFAEDEILKNAFANYAFENFEVASYKSLIVLANSGSFTSAVDPLRGAEPRDRRGAANPVPAAVQAWRTARVCEGPRRVKWGLLLRVRRGCRRFRARGRSRDSALERMHGRASPRPAPGWRRGCRSA
jgi:ferritin-like metal-binding protein YciE